jgi:murein DD-endopeptidase MepM/ murein hydrolase activator NlpD
VDGYGSAGAFFSADSADEVLQRAATLEHLGDDRAEQLDQFETVEQQQQDATTAAKAAVDARDSAARAAAEAERIASEQLTSAQAAYDAAVAQRAVLDQELQAAREQVRTLGGDSTPVDAAPENEQSGEQGQQAAAGAGVPTTGRVTSCYGARWGTTHLGVDIANAIGTPIYAPEEGVVLQAGPASGFGLAVYLQHPDGSITVYGHINQYFVQAGEQVAAGQQIAEIGNKGQSTGAHLHFEVHNGGLYQNRVNPVPWLAARGISLGGACAS